MLIDLICIIGFAALYAWLAECYFRCCSLSDAMRRLIRRDNMRGGALAMMRRLDRAERLLVHRQPRRFHIFLAFAWVGLRKAMR